MTGMAPRSRMAAFLPVGASDQERAAAVIFASAHEAERQIAGLPAAARIVREVAEAGFAEVRLVIPGGGVIGPPTWHELRRLAGTTRVVVASDAGDAQLVLPGDRMIPAEFFRRNDTGTEAGFALDRNAAARIVRATGKTSDGPVSRWINRPVSRLISVVLLNIPGIRPLHATCGTALLALLMLAALIAGGQPGLIAGALLFQAASIFDGVDGEIARATFRSSRAGAVLDSAVDVITNAGFILGLAINIGSRGSATAYELAGWGVALFLIGLTIIAWRASRADGPFTLDIVKQQYRRRFSGAASSAVIRFMIVVASRDFFALLFAILILVGLPMAVLALFAAAAVVWFLFVLCSILLPIQDGANEGHPDKPSLQSAQ